MNYLFLIPALPFAGFVILAILGGRMLKTAVAIVGAGSVGLSALITFIIGYRFLVSPPSGHTFTQTLWTWMQFGSYEPSISFTLDPLSLVMIFVITFVGFLIHL